MRTGKNRINGTFRNNKINIFSESSLVILISIVTLFLQTISFATTWSGSKVYLEGVFPYASLLFALAIQATAYFLSNSLRTRITLLKIVAMTVALCCSTYYSYIGIYNSVNSPVSYLQENYMRISDDLNRIYDSSLETGLSSARLAVGNAYSQVSAKYSSLTNTQANIDACLEALSAADTSYSQKLRAPKQADYETYEEYAAAYQAYIATISSGSKTEKETVRADILSSYGFADMKALNEAQTEYAAAVSALEAALGTTGNNKVVSDNTENEDSNFSETLSSLYLDLTTALDGVSAGQPLDDNAMQKLTGLLHTASLCSTQSYDLAALKNTMDLCAKAANITLMADYQTLVGLLPEGVVTSANTMTLKGNMDSQILSAIITLNSLLPQNEQIDLTDSRFQIMDLYLIPIQALTGESTRTTAFFCLSVAALIDALSVLFAVSIRKRKPVWKRTFLLQRSPDEYLPQICAALPFDSTVGETPLTSLAAFLSWFSPSPETECDGYMMKANAGDLEGFYPLIALLCQINLAKILPTGFTDNENEIVLLRARFVFWANAQIYEDYSQRQEVPV